MFKLIPIALVGWMLTAGASQAQAEEPVEAAPEAAPEARGATNYTLQANKSWVWVMVLYSRNAMMAGHDHAVKASQFTGDVTWDPTNASNCKINVKVPVSSLQVDPSGMRKRAGLEGETADGDKGKILANLSGKHQLEGSKFPDITFNATSCSGTSGWVNVTGQLKMHNITKTVTARMKITEDGQTFRAKGTFETTHSAHGFKPFTAALGMIRNDDKLGFHLDFVGSK